MSQENFLKRLIVSSSFTRFPMLIGPRHLRKKLGGNITLIPQGLRPLRIYAPAN